MYKPEDFDNLYWNPITLKGSPRKAWNTLNLYKEFEEKLIDIDETLFFNYMQLVYHKGSVLVKDFDALKDRKERALDILGITKRNGKYPEGIQRVVDGENKFANRMIIRFCTIQNNQTYSLLQVLGTAYDRLLFKMMSDADTEDVSVAVELSTKAAKELSSLLAQIDKYKEQVFMSDKNIADQADEDFISYARVPGYPELLMAGKIKV